jgi:hypothetical protein
MEIINAKIKETILGRYLKVGITIIGMVSCLAVILPALEDPPTLFYRSSSIAGAFDNIEGPAEKSLPRIRI